MRLLYRTDPGAGTWCYKLYLVVFAFLFTRVTIAVKDIYNDWAEKHGRRDVFLISPTILL